MEIAPENLERLGFSPFDDRQPMCVYKGISVTFSADKALRNVWIRNLIVPHAKTIEHIQQLMNLFIGMPEKEETLLDKIVSVCNDLIRQGKQTQAKKIIAQYPDVSLNGAAPAYSVRKVDEAYWPELYEKLLNL